MGRQKRGRTLIATGLSGQDSYQQIFGPMNMLSAPEDVRPSPWINAVFDTVIGHGNGSFETLIDVAERSGVIRGWICKWVYQTWILLKIIGGTNGIILGNH